MEKHKLGAFGNVISILLFENCGVLIRETQLEAARRARNSGIPFGFTDCGLQSGLLDRAIQEGCTHGLVALINIYMRMEVRHVRLENLLRQLAVTAKVTLRNGETSIPGYRALIDLSRVDGNVANFFLLALTSPAVLEPHLDALMELGDSFLHRPRTRLARTLSLYIEHEIPTDAIQLDHYSTLEWARDWGRRLRCPLGYPESTEEKEDHNAFLHLIDAIEALPRGSEAV
jgi:hypothetical protein